MRENKINVLWFFRTFLSDINIYESFVFFFFRKQVCFFFFQWSEPCKVQSIKEKQKQKTHQKLKKKKNHMAMKIQTWGFLAAWNED